MRKGLRPTAVCFGDDRLKRLVCQPPDTTGPQCVTADPLVVGVRKADTAIPHRAPLDKPVDPGMLAVLANTTTWLFFYV